VVVQPVMANGRERGPFLSVMAVLFAVLALSNFSKAWQHVRDPHLGFVIFGVRCETLTTNLLLGGLFGVGLAAYAWGLWRMKAWVVPLSIVYAFYVPTNLVLFWYRDMGPTIPSLGFILFYLAVAFTGSIGTALYLVAHRDRLT
jgi:hypothetical protein